VELGSSCDDVDGVELERTDSVNDVDVLTPGSWVRESRVLELDVNRR
jgi:hypothetical protein